MGTPTSPEPGRFGGPASGLTIPDLSGCGRWASGRIEMYSPRVGQARSSLDAVTYACAAHLDTIERMVAAAGYTPYRTAYKPTPEDVVHPVCGTVRRLGPPSGKAPS